MTQLSFNRLDLIKSAEFDLDLFASLLLGDSFTHKFSQVHYAYWDMLLRSAISGKVDIRYALGLPRGFAKTTLIKLFVVWCFLYTDRQFIIVVSSSQGLAENVVSDIADFLDTENVRAVWGNWRLGQETDRQDKKKFKFLGKDRILVALGAESSMRGMNIKNERPDLIVLEDAQNKESAESPTRNDAFLSWFLGTLIKARSYKRSMIVFIGNMYNEICILNQLKGNTQWLSFVAPGILYNRESLWPEFRSFESLMDEFQHDLSMGKPEIFLAEVMNDPTATAASSFDASAVPLYPFGLEEIPDGAFLTVDPATGKDAILADPGQKTVGKKAGNMTAICLNHVIDGKCVTRRIYAGLWDDEKTVTRSIEIALEEGCSLIIVEAVAYQAILQNKFVRALTAKNILGISVKPILPKGISKNNRIAAYLGRLIPKGSKKPDQFIHPEARVQIFFQASRWKQLKKDNDDDSLDAAAYGDIALQEHWQEITYRSQVWDQESKDVRVWETEETCAF